MSPIDPSAVRTYYRWMAPFYDATRWLFLFDRKYAVDQLCLRPTNTVLEIGAGTGYHLQALSRAVGPEGRVYALDFSRAMLRRARRNLRPNVHLLCADAQTFALRTTFHAILYSYSLSMIPDPRASLECALRHLAPGGRIAIVDFGNFGSWGPAAFLARRWLAWNNVRPGTEALHTIRPQLARLDVTSHRGGYNYIAVGTK